MKRQTSAQAGSGMETAGGARFHWRDSSGDLWEIDAEEASLTVRRDAEVIEIPRDRWSLDVSIAPLERGYVVRFSGSERDVGFLVGDEGAILEALLRRAVTAPPKPATPILAAPDDRPVLFPKMNRATVWALLLAALAFIPVWGAGFAAASVVLLVAGRRKLRASRDFAHIRAMRRFTLVWLAFNTGVWAMTTIRPEKPARYERIAAAAAWMAHPRNEPPKAAYIVAAIVAALFSLSIHECAHAITALWNGDDYARSLGRVTLNPLSHIDLFGTVILPALLFFSTGMTFGYARPVPVIPSRMMFHRISDIYVSAAGPVSNLLIASACMALYLLIGRIVALVWPGAVIWDYSVLSPTVEVVGAPAAAFLTAALRMLSILVLMNVGLAFFNLLPIPPLDGSHVCGNLYPRTMGRFYEVIAPYQTPLFILLLWTGALNFMLAPTFGAAVGGLQWMTSASGWR